MTLDVFPDPRVRRARAADRGEADPLVDGHHLQRLPVVGDHGPAHPARLGRHAVGAGEPAGRHHPHHLLDGQGQGAPTAITLAQLVRAYLLNSGSAATWRFRRGPGPIPGVDPATELPFCTFILTAETRPTRVA